MPPPPDLMVRVVLVDVISDEDILTEGEATEMEQANGQTAEVSASASRNCRRRRR